MRALLSARRSISEGIPVALGLWRSALALSHYPIRGYLLPPMRDILVVQVASWSWILAQGVAVWFVARFALVRGARFVRSLPAPVREPLRAAALFALAFAAWGLLAQAWIPRPPAEASWQMFYRLFLAHETPFLAGLGAFAAICLGAAPRLEDAPPARPFRAPGWLPAALAVAALVFCRVGARIAMHDYDFAADEFSENYQSQIFASGHLTAPVPPRWQSLAVPLTPTFVALLPRSRSWIAGQLPVFALIRAGFVAARIARWTGPAMAALAILLFGRIARRLWPDDGATRLVAILFLVSSSQFLFTAMSDYAMSAGLAFNLLWLTLYLERRPAARLLLPWVGVAALGVHYPLEHALFVMPFLARMLWTERKRWIAYVAAVYGAGCCAWWKWLGFWQPGAGRGTGYLFVVPGSHALFRQGLSVALLATWATPVLAVLLLAAGLCWRRLSPVARCLLAGIALDFAFYLFIVYNQGHGWGYRYAHGIVGNAALAAAFGFHELRRRHPVSLPRLVALSLLITAGLQIPLRWRQVERSIRPFYLANRYLRALPADVVGVSPSQTWYAGDLVRNDPFLQWSPKIVNVDKLTPRELAALRSLMGERIRVVSPADLARFGLPVLKRPPSGPGS